MHPIPYSSLKKGTLLIASPDIDEGIFFRSVILLCDHSPVGSFGVIINKPLEIDIPSEMPALENFPDTHIDVRNGGPNQPNQMMLLHSCEQEAENNLTVCQGVYLGGDLECIQEMSSSPDSPSLLLCLGYSGWGSGLLEKEFLNGEWFLHPASSMHVFKTPPDLLWRTLLCEMGGKYKMLSMIPEDLSLN